MYTFSFISLRPCRSYPIASIRSRPKRKREQLLELEHTGKVSKFTYRDFVQRQAKVCRIVLSTSLTRIIPACALTLAIIWILDTPAIGLSAVNTGTVPRDEGIANFTCELAGERSTGFKEGMLQQLLIAVPAKVKPLF
jgi:hypothetical protein